MNLDKQTTIIGSVSAVFVAANTLLTSFTSFGEQLQGAVGKFVALPLWAIWVTSSVAGLLAAYLVWSWRAHRSVLLRPERLRLERANKAHLVGREDEIEDLSKDCHTYALVHLEGESGSGKSALIEAGLIPAVRA